MATSAKLTLDLRKPKKDGTFPIVLRITHQRTPVYIIYEYSVFPEHWDKVAKCIISKCKKYDDRTWINNYLLEQQVNANKIINNLKGSNELEPLTADELRIKIMNKGSKVTFREFTEKIIKELETANKFGNASVYKQAIGFMDRYLDKADFTFNQINFKLLKKLESKHLAKDNSLNSLSFYFRTIRSVYNRAIKEDIAKRDLYPFENYSIRETKPAKRAVPKSDIEKIRDAKLEKGSNHWHARNYFMFSFYNIGMNFIDIAFLKKKNIVDGRLNYTRAKTGKIYSVKISEPAKAILSHYLKGKKDDDFVFNIVTGEKLPEQLASFRLIRRYYNKWLKQIAKSCKIEANITSYVARHSWATIAKDLNVPVSVISEGLGHEDIKTTQIYLDSFEVDVIDKANLLITE
jgi:integrase/recombinase XerD